MQELLDLLRSNNLIIPAIVAGISGTILFQAKNIVMFIWGIFYTSIANTYTIENNLGMFNRAMIFFGSQPKCWGQLTYAATLHTGENDILDMGVGTRFFYISNIGLVKVSYTATLKQAANDSSDNYVRTLEIVTFGSKTKLLELQKILIDLKVGKELTHLKVQTAMRTEYIPKSTRAQTIMSDKLYAQTCGRAKQFLNDRSTYAARGINFKLGMCLYGPPGTGKTSLIKLIASEINAPIITIANVGDLFDGPGLMWQVSSCTLEDKPVIVVIEDIKSLTPGKDQKDCRAEFLNYIDGLTTPQGMIIILTTNYLEELPKELLRPGRMDVCVEVGYLQTPEAIKICQKFDIDISEDDAHLLVSSRNLTSAMLQEYILGDTLYQEIESSKNTVTLHVV